MVDLIDISTTPAPKPKEEFFHQKHVTFWKRNLRTYLPHHYTSNDCHRLLLAFFTLSALDLLGALHESTTVEERTAWADWIYTCQHEDGGFRGSPALDLRDCRSAENRVWDPANVPGTYFALASLLLLRDDLSRVKRTKCLAWLKKMQRDEGSLGETLGFDGKVEGGTDTRFAYTGMGIRWILRGQSEGECGGIPDINLDSLVNCIREAETFEGGISEQPFHEPHGGYTYCALATLFFIGRLSTQSKSTGLTAPSDPEHTIHWLISRQTDILDEDQQDDEYDRPVSDPLPAQDISCTGWNGRCNKIADTCYCWWGTAALHLLGHTDLDNTAGTKSYLLEKTQHAIIGGFGKHGGYPPDLYHSHLGLAVMSLMHYDGLKLVHPAACFSWETVRYMESLAWRREIWDIPEPEPANPKKKKQKST